ncbi:MAG: hypothetical protein FJW37_01065 [Acidobacteria bacterium]|nr:hypothetical protein [Acidobacteriota bacterium]
MFAFRVTVVSLPLAALTACQRTGENKRGIVDKLSGETPPRLVDFSARVITKTDLEKPEIRALLFPDSRKHLN